MGSTQAKAKAVLDSVIDRKAVFGGTAKSKCTIFISARDMPACLETKNLVKEKSFHGSVRPEAKDCWFSFPGKFPAGWAALAELHHGDSVACVFLCDPEDGLGQHDPNPDCPGDRCLCNSLYGKRGYEKFGYYKEVASEELASEEATAAAQNQVLICKDASPEDRQRAKEEAKRRYHASGEATSWGCRWYTRWLAKVKDARRRGQRLKGVFFPGQVGLGKLDMTQLSDPRCDPWDGIGCGGSQKCEFATADRYGWEYDEVDVAQFMAHAWQVGQQVDGKDGNTWRRGVISRVLSQPAASSDREVELKWMVTCRSTGKEFTTRELRHCCQAMSHLISEYGEGYLRDLFSGLLDGREVQLDEVRGQSGTSALSLTFEVGDIASLHVLRDKVLSDALECSINGALSRESARAPWEVRVDKSHFVEDYERSCLSLSTLTRHQEEKLAELGRAESAHLSAPAGAGKTFVAVQHVLEVLEAQAASFVLFVAPEEPLALHFVRWLHVRLGAGGADVQLSLQRLAVLFHPFSEGFRGVSVRAGRICLEPLPGTSGEQRFQLAVVDEAHHVYRDGSGWDRAGPTIQTERWLLLSDEGQCSAAAAHYPGMKRVQLSEVARCTKRIVLGASSFRGDGASQHTAESLGTDGPPLKTFIFEPKSTDSDAWAEYVEHTTRAIRQVTQEFPGMSLHNRVALLVPNKSFREDLLKGLPPSLAKHIPNRRFSFATAVDSLAFVPQPLSGPLAPELAECLVLEEIAQFDGLEQLIVIAVGLDEVLTSTSVLRARSHLYRAISRAQLMFVIVNQNLPGGWLEFLATIKLSDTRDLQAQQHREIAAGAAGEVVSTWSPPTKTSGEREDKLGLVIADGEQEGAPHETDSDEESGEDSAIADEDAAGVDHQVEQSVWDTSGNSFVLKSRQLRFNPYADWEFWRPEPASPSQLVRKALPLLDGVAGGSGIEALMSFPGIHQEVWNEVAALADLMKRLDPSRAYFSTAEVFLPDGDPNFGRHHANDVDNDGRCFCLKIYGEKKEWGCEWFNLQRNQILECLRRGQKPVVCYRAGQVGQGDTANWDDFPIPFTTDRRGLGGSQAAGVAFLKLHVGEGFIKRDVGDMSEALYNTGRRKMGRLIRKTGCRKLSAAIGDSVPIQQGLKKLPLHNAKIGDSGMAYLAKALPLIKALEVLGLPGNSIGDAGAAALAEQLPKLAALNALDLGRNDIGEAGAVALAGVLPALNAASLNALDLGSNDIGEAGAVALARVLLYLFALKQLSLKGNSIGDAGARALAEELPKLPSLKALDLGRNDIGEAGAVALAGALPKLGSLEQLSLKGNAIGEAGAAALRAAARRGPAGLVLSL